MEKRKDDREKLMVDKKWKKDTTIRVTTSARLQVLE
jgi:hypothetical protein